jgi:acetyl esterase/lipase
MDAHTRRFVLQLLLATPGLVSCLPRAAQPGETRAARGKQLTAGGIRKLADLAYASGPPSPAQTLDLYLPAAAPAAAARPVPLLVYFHGGAWVSGDKEQYALLGLSLATQGLAVAIPNYRLSGDGSVRHPAHVQDAAAAVAWLRRHAAAQGLDGDRIVVAGHSAGAYLSALLAFAPAYLAAVGEKPESLRGFIGLEGIYDLEFLATRFPAYRDDFLVAAFGPGEALWRAASPQNLQFKLQRPWLVLHSQEDELVDIEQSQRFAAALGAHGVPVEYIVTPRGNHFGVVSQLSLPLSPLAGQVIRFTRAATEPLPAPR